MIEEHEKHTTMAGNRIDSSRSLRSLEDSLSGDAFNLPDSHGPSAFHNGAETSGSGMALRMPVRQPTLDVLPDMMPSPPSNSHPAAPRRDGGVAPRMPRRTATNGEISLQE